MRSVGYTRALAAAETRGYVDLLHANARLVEDNKVAKSHLVTMGEMLRRAGVTLPLKGTAYTRDITLRAKFLQLENMTGIVLREFRRLLESVTHVLANPAREHVMALATLVVRNRKCLEAPPGGSLRSGEPIEDVLNTFDAMARLSELQTTSEYLGFAKVIEALRDGDVDTIKAVETLSGYLKPEE